MAYLDDVPEDELVDEVVRRVEAGAAVPAEGVVGALPPGMGMLIGLLTRLLKGPAAKIVGPRIAQEWTDLELGKGAGKSMGVGEKVHLADYHSRQGDFSLDGTKTGDHAPHS